ncbi:uncharacterized protein [Spinacia oleracea]|uniref:Uncharacterized protein n=1 Tax=Spinacia oleracea TaxID=3562 RepID=A0A9R0K054_SPIOL|nr:uncharacterized protein LOC110792430 [Spinacia oleracea]
MQYSGIYSQGRRGYPYHSYFYRPTEPPRNFYYPPPPPPPPPPSPPPSTAPTNYYQSPNLGGYPPSYYPSGFPNNYNNPFIRYSYNSGGNRYDGHGIQRNGDVKIGNANANANGKRKERKNTVIGGSHGNIGGHQVSGDVILGDLR